VALGGAVAHVRGQRWRSTAATGFGRAQQGGIASQPSWTGGYRVNYGSSYIQAVSFDARGPVAYGLLTYGQSSSAQSPHAYDQLPLFSAKQWVPLPFLREDVQAQRVAPPLVLGY
jgi:acyl-homoserine lactone acylase PvdQ